MSQEDARIYGDQSEDAYPRCWRCNRLLAEMVTRPWIIVCTRCKAKNQQTS